MGLKTARGRLFIFLSLVIFCPLLQHLFTIITNEKLNGQYVAASDIHFTPDKWWDGSYQKQKSLFLNDSFGLRIHLVRLNDQIDFTLFNQIHEGDVFVGRDNYLFSKTYVDEYEGMLPIDINAVRKQLIRLKMVQDTLGRLGKTFIFTYALSKPYIYPDKIPSILLSDKGDKRNTYYNLLRRLGDSIGIRQIDFNGLLLSKKDSIHGILSAKYGCHWSTFGSLIALDTLIKFIEHERNIKMHELTVTGMHYTNDEQNRDADYAAATNLIFPLNEKFCYPDYLLDTTSGKIKPKIIFIGDSYVWTWIYRDIFDTISQDWEYWNYFSEVWSQKILDGKEQVQHVDHGYWQRSIQDADCIVSVFTPMNFKVFDRESFYVNTMYNYYYPNRPL